MSRPRGPWDRCLASVAVAALVGLLFAPGPVTGQLISEASEAELLNRLDSLYPLVVEARQAAAAAAVERRDEEERRRATGASRVDTLRVGLVRIVTPVAQVHLARELFEEVWTESFRGVDRSPVLEGAWFAFQWSDDRVPIYLAENPRTVQPDRRADRDQVKAQIWSAIASTVTYDLSVLRAPLGLWLRGNPFDNRTAERLSDAYRIVATTPSIATEACLDGNQAACLSALGLTIDETIFDDLELARGMLDEWYEPGQRRAYAASLRIDRSRPTTLDSLVAGCVDRGDLDACDEVILRRYGLQGPLPGSIRATVLSLAMELGGEGAWGRLLDEPELSAAEALERISGRPVEELITEWRARVIANRTEPHVGLASGSGLAALWTLMFAGLAMRSTRWRLG